MGQAAIRRRDSRDDRDAVKRRVPADDELTRIFRENVGESSRQILDRYGWDVSLNSVQMYRRKLRRRSAIAGVASMSRDEFRAAMAVTLLDKSGGGR